MYKWICQAGDHTISVSDSDKPEGQCPDHWEWIAKYAEGRIHADRYTPYHGKGEWGDSANRWMAERAKSNFQRKQNH